jgi:hypothetical protein
MKSLKVFLDEPTPRNERGTVEQFTPIHTTYTSCDDIPRTPSLPAQLCPDCSSPLWWVGSAFIPRCGWCAHPANKKLAVGWFVVAEVLIETGEASESSAGDQATIRQPTLRWLPHDPEMARVRWDRAAELALLEPAIDPGELTADCSPEGAATEARGRGGPESATRNVAGHVQPRAPLRPFDPSAGALQPGEWPVRSHAVVIGKVLAGESIGEYRKWMGSTGIIEITYPQAGAPA